MNPHAVDRSGAHAYRDLMHTLSKLLAPPVAAGPEAAQATNHAAIARLAARWSLTASEAGCSVFNLPGSPRRAGRAAKPRCGTLRGPQRPFAPFQANHPSQQPLWPPSRHPGRTASIHARPLEPVLTGAVRRFQPIGSIFRRVSQPPKCPRRLRKRQQIPHTENQDAQETHPARLRQGRPARRRDGRRRARAGARQHPRLCSRRSGKLGKAVWGN